MEGVRKAILRIDCENGTKEAVSSPNEAARKILNHGSTDMAFGQEKCEIVVQYNPASIKYRTGISQNRSIKYERQNKEVYKITAITGESTADISFTLVFHSRFEGDPSVQEQMDLLFNMIRRSPEKQIEFLWSNIYMCRAGWYLFQECMICLTVQEDPSADIWTSQLRHPRKSSGQAKRFKIWIIRNNKTN